MPATSTGHDDGSDRRVADDVTVVVPTLGRPVLKQTLSALFAGEVLPRRTIVVHQGVDPETARLCADMRHAGFPCVYVATPAERGAAAARNRGVERTRTPLVAMIDDDCAPAADWLARIVGALRADPKLVVTGQVLSGGTGAVPSLMDLPEPTVHRAPLLRRDVLFAGCMGFALDLYHRVGPWSEAEALIPAAEDNEWAYRVVKAGFAIRYEPRARVVHLDWRTPEEELAVERRYALGQGGFYGMHLRRGDRFILRRAMLDLGRAGKRMLVGVQRRDRQAARLGALRLRTLLRGLWRGLRE